MKHNHEQMGRLQRVSAVIMCLAVVVCSYVTYFKGYEHPQRFFWDENYHVTSAQKYLHGVHFMELHPPLGKLLIAAGEKLLHPNEKTDHGLSTMYLDSHKDPMEPEFAMSFKGYRFFPALMGACVAPLLFCFLLVTTKRVSLAALGAFLVVFDNAMVVHARGAMLDGIQLFWIVAALLAFGVGTYSRRSLNRKVSYLLCGGMVGCAIATKVTSLILVVLIGGMLLHGSLKGRIGRVFLALVGCCIALLGTWFVHFSLMTREDPELEAKERFGATPRYTELLRQPGGPSLLNVVEMLPDVYRYSFNYNTNVQSLNLCKEDVLASHPLTWPLGGRSINYGWRKNGEVTRYLYLQANPVVWGLALLGVVLAVIVVGSAVLLPVGEKPRRLREISLLLIMYLVYMAAMLNVSRVMFPYHYFIPLVFGIALLSLSLGEIERLGPVRLSGWLKSIVCACLVACAFGSFLFFKPLSYYEPLTDQEISARALLSVWDLRCTSCELTNSYARPVDGDSSSQGGYSAIEMFPE